MRILTMLTILSFCGNVFAQNSARESALGSIEVDLSTYNIISYNVSHSIKNVDRADGDRAVALAALPLELANSIPITEFVANLKSPIVSNSLVASRKKQDFARAMAVYSPEMAREMVGIVPTPKSPNRQLVKQGEKSNS